MSIFKKALKGLGEIAKESYKEAKAEGLNHVFFQGRPLQNIGQIVANEHVGILANDTKNIITLQQGKKEIILPYERVVSFIVNRKEIKHKKDVEYKWIATLTYKTKEGATAELQFLEEALVGTYKDKDKSSQSKRAEKKFNRKLAEHREEITEL